MNQDITLHVDGDAMSKYLRGIEPSQDEVAVWSRVWLIVWNSEELTRYKRINKV